jgi:hypothetical protein
MNPETRSPDGAKEEGDKGAARQTPSTDMQPEDTGTPESGNESGNPARESAAEKAMKQTSKTPAERDAKG